jgi:hypothetical protein
LVERPLRLAEMKPGVDLEGSQMSSTSLSADDLLKRVAGMVGKQDVGALTVGVLGPTAHPGLPLKVFSRSRTVSTTVAKWFVPIARETVDKIYRFGPLRDA